ncbi:YdeI/OmpD-associated family protein [Oceanicola sp. S124]|uniref:YdeI/OmpD-associated family protein n=1 Tax=Oceanicola sp. S124 TaxID=1042378 RepID=UPI0002559C64|nr:YdeI/OmpD-associated family protein [Oceanicola sp. S124]
MITDPDDFFTKGCGRCARFETPDCAALRWSAVLEGLRALCRDAGLEETAKWGHPCYMHAGRNIALIGAFRDNVRLTFFNAALMQDPEGVLRRQGPNTRHPDMIRLTGAEELPELGRTITAYLGEAMRYAEQGITAPKEPRALDMPDELGEALDADPELSEAFHALTPGRQRSYLFNLATAKQSATRFARIAKFRDKILAGKGATER